MSIVAPTQQRSVDPYDENRFSSVINRLSRTLTGGDDVILSTSGDESFEISNYIEDSTSSYDKIEIDHGLCIKDDVLVHVTEDNYVLDFSDSDNYIDPTGGMTSAGWYYVVLHYSYSRQYPPTKGFYMIIRDTATWYTGHEDNYIFLAAVNIVYNSTLTRYEVGTSFGDILYYDPDDPTIKRKFAAGQLNCLDGGEIT